MSIHLTVALLIPFWFFAVSGSVLAQDMPVLQPSVTPDASIMPDMVPERVPVMHEARTFVWDVLTGEYDPAHIADSYKAALDRPLVHVLETVPIPLSGIVSMQGRDTLYIGIDAEYYAEHGAKELRRELVRRFPSVPIHIEPTEGIQHANSGVKDITVPRAQTLAASLQDDDEREELVFTDNTNFVIEDNTKSMREAGTIEVPGAEFVHAVTLDVNIKHTYVSDLRVMLVSPTGVSHLVYDGTAGPDDDSDDLVRSWRIPNTFRNLPASGTWRLLIGDYVVNDGGVLRSWRLRIQPTGTPVQAPGFPVDVLDTEDPSYVFFDGFERGFHAWRTTTARGDEGWQAQELDSGDRIPGYTEDNIVAQSQDCDSVCHLTLSRPLDLTGYDRITLSFDRWVDKDIDSGEFLSVEIGKDGSYRELDRWTPERGDNDNRWRHEVYRLTPDDFASSAFTIRFSSKNSSLREEIAVDNIQLSSSEAPPADDRPTETHRDGFPHEDCLSIPKNETVMGGDILFGRPADDTAFDEFSCATMTLGGVRTQEGKEGVIVSGHFVNMGLQYDDMLIGHAYDSTSDALVHVPIGRAESQSFVVRPDVLGWSQNLPTVIADAAFVEYPQSSRCTIVWRVDGDDYCFQHAYRRTAESMKIRGEHGSIYTVTGSQTPTAGLDVMVSGAMSGELGPTPVVHELLHRHSRTYQQYVYALSEDLAVRHGDSGSPVYTVPDSDGAVSIVGSIIGFLEHDGEVYRIFSSWDSITEALGLVKI